MAPNRTLVSADATTYLINHIIFPPKLPQEDDRDPDNDRRLLTATMHALEDFRDAVPPDDAPQVEYVLRSIGNTLNILDENGYVSEAQLLEALQGLQDGTVTGAIPLEIKTQNSGILISVQDCGVSLEAFELSALNEDVMTTGGRLRRTFPAFTAHLSMSTYKEQELQSSLARALAKMSRQSASGFQPQAKRSGRCEDIRGTATPALATSYVMNVLAAISDVSQSSCDEAVLQIVKNTRDDILSSNGRELPWRRSPLWLLVRVSAQLAFSRYSPGKSPDMYKAFTIFFISKILANACEHIGTLGSEIVLAISAKLSRRLVKMQDALEAIQSTPQWLEQVRQSMSAAHDTLTRRWKIIRGKLHTNSIVDTAALKGLHPENDLDVALPDLDRYLADINARKTDDSCKEFKPTSWFTQFPPQDLPNELQGPGEYQFFRLAAFESWTEQHLTKWLKSHLDSTATSGALYGLIRRYHAIASSTYANKPRDMSTMYLTIMELWVASDMSTCHIHPLLKDFDHEIPVSQLEQLLLPSESQLARLNKVEAYLDSRRKGVKPDAPSIYRDFGHGSSFPVHYYRQSPSHQRILSEIEREATAKQEEKLSELANKQQEYRRLAQQHETLTCTYYSLLDSMVHANGCKKCVIWREIQKIGIEIYEWPISSDPDKAKAIVFELDIPLAFRAHRDLSTFVIIDVLSSQYRYERQSRSTFRLSNDPGLSSRFRGDNSHRIGILSQAKPHSVTHRKIKRAFLDLSEEDVCLENGLSYRAFDEVQHAFTDDFTEKDGISKQCLFKLPQDSARLQKYLVRAPSTPHGGAPNEVLASQHHAPGHLSLGEYKALCGLPLGYNIQYSNILAQIAVPAIDFGKVETQIMILQTVLQASEPSEDRTVERDAHVILADDAFGKALIAQLTHAVHRITDNWELWRAMSTYVLLTLRLSSLAQSEEITQQCLSLLADCRMICTQWLETLTKSMLNSTEDDHRVLLSSRATEVALLTISTFDLDGSELESALSTSHASSTFIRCSMIIRDKQSSTKSDHKQLYESNLQVWRRLCYRVFPTLKKMCCTGTCLDDAVSATWAGFHSTQGWRAVEEKNAQGWLVTKSSPLGSSSEVVVHFNLLTAELLVNGLPAARLPPEYTSTDEYSVLFAGVSVAVIPASVPGFKFEAKHTIKDYVIRFGLEGPSLLVQASQNGGRFDLLPSSLLHGKFPPWFVNQYMHWYNHEDNSIVFTERKDPLGFCQTSNWHLSKEDGHWQLRKQGLSLVNVASNTAAKLSETLIALEDQNHIHLVHNRTLGHIDIDLPRLQLGFRFTWGDSRIFSRQYRGMYIDPNQSIDTLIGLSTKLVLKHESRDADRLILVPEGSVEYKRTTDHVDVSIAQGTVTKVHAYRIDPILGKLAVDGKLQSTLVLCYMHALTSFCLPDPLSRCTGTESALSILQSGAARSFETLGQDNIDILVKISNLTPARTFYPQKETVMQYVEWDSRLKVFSQHHMFHSLVEQIFERSRLTKPFFGGIAFIDPPKSRPTNPRLIRRELIRCSGFHISGAGAEKHTLDLDKDYKSREDEHLEKGKQSFIAATLVLRPEAALHSPIPTNFNERLWNILKGNTVQGPLHGKFEPADLDFDAKWLQPPAPFMSELWCRIHHHLAHSPHKFTKYDVAMWLSTVAFSMHSGADVMDVVQILMAFYRFSNLPGKDIPQVSHFDLYKGKRINTDELKSCFQQALQPYEGWGDPSFTQRLNETSQEFDQRRQAHFMSKRTNAIDAAVAALKRQWPRAKASIPLPDGRTHSPFFQISKVMASVRPKFEAWYQNKRFGKYLQNLTTTLSHQSVVPVSLPTRLNPQHKVDTVRRMRSITPEYLFTETSPPSLPNPPQPPQLSDLTAHEGHESPQHLRVEVLHHFMKFSRDLLYHHTSGKEAEYVAYLDESFEALMSLPPSSPAFQLTPGAPRILTEYFEACRLHLSEVSRILHQALVGESNASSSDTLFVKAEEGGSADSLRGMQLFQLPRVCPSFFLRQLNHQNWTHLSQGWKDTIIQYALAVTGYQRAQRMFSKKDSQIDLFEEIQNPGHKTWSPHEFPEILLMEVESGILIREVQQNIANHMRNPLSGQNTVMQLNMGEGKSTVIVPIVASALADTEKLVRVIVAKPQSKQMLQMLVSKLGGLLNRRIYQVPFSRAVKLDEEQVEILRKIYQECIEARGIILLQPEHILSFKLMGIECLLGGRPAMGKALLDIQQFLHDKSRDIVDECDDNFSPKFELAYTYGTQMAIDFSPHRWNIIHKVLELVARYSETVKHEMPDFVEISGSTGNGRVPIVRILKEEASTRLLQCITDHICTYGLPAFPVHHQPQSMRDSVRHYIISYGMTQEEIDEVEKSTIFTESTKIPLLLLRGLIAGGLLSFVLMGKRYRVNFGVDPNRTPKTRLAVPFRSKDSPTPRSEFSHPDVTIVTTSWCYYYGGLSDTELFEAFQHLVNSDQASTEYEQWTTGITGLPETFRHLSGVNLEDQVQCANALFPFLRYCKAAVDYWLANIVFPKELKEFPQKLSASGWDIGEHKVNPTTGFSGTNDSRHVLPMSVEHLDLPSQKHTNALVLSYLLQTENSVELLLSKNAQDNSITDHLLTRINSIVPTPRVILDAGAQILDLSNAQLAERWLAMSDTETIKGAVYVNDDEELVVLDRSGVIESLQASPFLKQLDLCIIYLDEAHTRGIDLKLPRVYRAVVTLGMKLTKDKLVQACMRMRKLGKGQSVVFLVPDDIRTKIIAQKQRGYSKMSTISVSDVLSWSITETWAELRANMPLWAAQGARYESHKDIFKDKNYTAELAEKFLEPEAQTIEDRYRPRAQSGTAADKLAEDFDMDNGMIRQIIQRCQDFRATDLGSAALNEEEERELAPEIESERQLERPGQMEPETHSVHQDVKLLADRGILKARSKAFIPAFKALEATKVAALFDMNQFPKDLLVTADYARTVKPSSTDFLDAFQWPVQWIISVPDAKNPAKTSRLVIISPFEANELEPIIWFSDKVTMHLYAPRPNLAYSPLDALDLYTKGRTFVPGSVPRSLIVQLNLFAGQLYFRSYKEYVELCDFLGLAYSAAKEGDIVQADGFITPPTGKWNLKQSPVKFLRAFVSNVRRDCEAIDKTHLGRVLNGALLEERDFK